MVDALVDIAKQRKVTQIILGESLSHTRGLALFNKPLIYQIFERTQNIDVYIGANG